MERVRRISYKDKEVIIADYSDCKEVEMIRVLNTVKEFVLNSNSSKSLVVAIFGGKTYVTPKFMRMVEKELREIENRIERNAITGLTHTQRFILKGVNLWYKGQIHDFPTLSEALDFLVS